jgi:hypothetical protein
MSANTKYGLCRGECQKWVPRDEMLSINVSVYDANNEELRIPLRFCPACHKKMQARLEEMRWDNVLKMEAEIRIDKDLAEASDLEFDPSPDALEAASEARARATEETSAPVKRPPPPKEKREQPKPKDDDSEAAMRRRGKEVDVNY